MTQEDLAFIDGWITAHDGTPLTVTLLNTGGASTSTERFYAAHDQRGDALYVGFDDDDGQFTHRRLTADATTAMVRDGVLHITHGENAYVVKRA